MSVFVYVYVFVCLTNRLSLCLFMHVFLSVLPVSFQGRVVVERTHSFTGCGRGAGWGACECRGLNGLMNVQRLGAHILHTTMYGYDIQL